MGSGCASVGSAGVERAAHQPGPRCRCRRRGPGSTDAMDETPCRRHPQRRSRQRDCRARRGLRARAAGGPPALRRRGGACRMARNRTEGRGRGRARDDERIRQRPGRHRCRDWPVAGAMLRRGRRGRGRSVPPRGSGLALARPMVHARTVRSAARRSMGRQQRPAGVGRSARRPGARRAAVHQDACGRAALLSDRQGKCRPDGGGDQGFSRRSASSIPRFDNRSASLLNSRRTCSNFTSSSCAASRRART